MTRLMLSDLSPKFQAQVAAQLRATPHPRTISVERAPDLPVAKKRIRQNSKGLNKTEAAFLEYLKEKFRGERVYSQSVTLLIGNGCRYTPDFIRVAADEFPRAYEVKGFMRDDAAVKLKVAATFYPWIAFHLVTRSKTSATGWSIEAVLP